MKEKVTEEDRIAKSIDNRSWKKWGPYMAERQWGTVREDYSADGNAWNYVAHDMARSKAYRWGEDGIAGFCDKHQILCLAPAFWNGNDPILKERLFGLTNDQGNHGEDVKELYYHLDSSPTHSYCKYLYKYPQNAFPYEELVLQNQRPRHEPEFEILDTRAFKNNAYFDIFIEYAKAGPNDILMKITAFNRGHKPAILHILPHLWFRNYWTYNNGSKRPKMFSVNDNCLEVNSDRVGRYFLYHEKGKQLFCDNETNRERLYSQKNFFQYPKDGINDHVVNELSTINPDLKGTKTAIWNTAMVSPGTQYTVRLRLRKNHIQHPWNDFDDIFNARIKECHQYYEKISPKNLPKHQKELMRSAFSGLLWTKQFYYLDIYKWMFGDYENDRGDKNPMRYFIRNRDWQHLTNKDIISMPDKWEYPWYAAWDLAFHATTFAHIDPNFAKNQLLLMIRENYMHPNGQIPAYEWNFSDVNPPVHAWAVWQVYKTDKKLNKKADFDFLDRSFQKLLMNFTWWVNQKDSDGNDVFEGGFLGLDNIGVFDRSNMPPGIINMQQADATSWMAMFALNMLRISLELAKKNPSYQESASKFFRHFLNIAWSIHHIGRKDISLWDDEDAFFYDAVQLEFGGSELLKIRSLIGIIPIFAIEIINDEIFTNLTGFKRRAEALIKSRPDLARLISRIEKKNEQGDHLFSIIRGHQLEDLLKRILDENEFLSDYGIRSLSKYHKENPFEFEYFGHKHIIQYEAGESNTFMFGGNSNWRGPIWLPMNYLLIQALRKFYKYYGPSYTYEFPTGSGKKLNLKEISTELTKRLLRIFEQDPSGKFNYYSDCKEFKKDVNFNGHHMFFEYFHGDTGQGLGASHQTGWTALIANLLLETEDEDEL